MIEWLTLALATFISEDVTCVAAGTLIARGQLSPASGITACTIGIVAGDVGLWWLGRFATTITHVCPWTARWYRATAVRARGSAEPLHRFAERAIVVSRFLPGTRLPLYVTAGAVGVGLCRFAAACALGAAIWTPAVILTTVALQAGGSAVPRAAAQSVLAEAILAGGALMTLRGLRMLGDERSRLRIAARFAR